MGNKTGCKKGQQKEKKECEGRILKTDSPPPPPPATPKKDELCLEMLTRQKKNLLNYIQLAEKYASSVKNLFFSHSHVNQPKTASKRGSGKKCCLFVTKIVILKSEKTGIKA